MARTSRPEMSAASYRHMASVMAARGNTRAEKDFLRKAKLAYENPLPAMKGWPYLKLDAFGNLRFDQSRGGQRYPEHTGVYNPGDRTRRGLKTSK